MPIYESVSVTGSTQPDYTHIHATYPLVSRGTYERLVAFSELFLHWQKTINLVAAPEELWPRHIEDSLQLINFLPAETKTVVDLGSGGGFPGLMLALSTSHHVHLIESDKRKSSFLREAARILGANVTLHPARIEEVSITKADIITARACAPLARLLSVSYHMWDAKTEGLFLKGKHHPDEIAEARVHWRFTCDIHPSLTNREGVILKINNAEPL